MVTRTQLRSLSRLAAGASDAVTIPVNGVSLVPAGATISYAAFVYTGAGSGTVDLTCDLVLRLDNANGSSPPY